MHLYRTQRGFFLLLGFSVIVLSFAYGISVGLKKPRHWANARPQVWEEPLDDAAETALRSELGLPDGVELSRLGKNATVNDRAATIVSFTTSVPADRILREQLQYWQSLGFQAVSREGAHRGILLGFDRTSRRKLSLSVWTVPEQIREAVSGGKPVQGMLSLLDDEKERVTPEGQFVPDVPVIPGGKGGAVFRSDDVQGETFSSVYSNPGSVTENVDFYRRELDADGWRETGIAVGEGKLGVGHLLFRRDEEEVVLLFSPSDTAAEQETVVAVFRGPKLEIQKRVF